MEKYSHSYSITAKDMDNFYRLTPLAILTYFEDCFARYMACLNLAAFDLIKQNKLWIITEFSADFTENNAYWSENITIEMWISQISPLRIYSDFVALKNDVIIAKGTSSWSILNSETRKLEKTDFLINKINIVQVFSTPHSKHRVPSFSDEISVVNHIVNLLDLDFNNHVNNVSYLSIALLTTTENFLTYNKLKHLYVNWLHETYIKDNIRCALTCENIENGQFVHILTNNNKDIVAKIYTEWDKTSHPKDVATFLKRG